MTDIRVQEHGDLLRIDGLGLVGVEWIEGRARIDELPLHSIHLRAELVKGSYQVAQLSVCANSEQPAPVTGEVLRMVPVHTLLTKLVQPVLALAQGYGYLIDKGVTRPPMLTLTGNAGSSLEDLYRSWVDRELDPTSPEFSAEVARIYRIARLTGDAPTKAVQETLGVSRASASRYVARARAAGELGVDETGHAGGAPARSGRAD